jgi:hypothetical protein
VETFIVRLWAPSRDLMEEVAEDELHGSVEHLERGRATAFGPATGSSTF